MYKVRKPDLQLVLIYDFNLPLVLIILQYIFLQVLKKMLLVYLLIVGSFGLVST